MTQEPEAKLTPPQNVYQAINRVQAALAKEGISKDRKNAQQNYSFRGIDDIFNALAPLLAEHHLCILPRITSREVTERVTKKPDGQGSTRESVLFYVVVKAEFDFISTDDGSEHTVEVYGEAMDSGDKATNKAMSAAYKYACLQAFCIPTEGDNDADATTHEVTATTSPASRQSTPAFESEAALITFTDTLSRAFGKAQTVANVEEIKTKNLAKLTAMQSSSAKEDRDAAARLKKDYDEAKAIAEAAEKAGQKPAQPRTVADALSSPKSPPTHVLADDEIPF